MVENMNFPDLIESILTDQENAGKRLDSEEAIELLFQKFWNGDNIWLRKKWKEFTEHESNSMMFDLKTGFKNFKSEMRQELEKGYSKELEEKGIAKIIEGDVCYLGTEETINAAPQKDNSPAPEVEENNVAEEAREEEATVDNMPSFKEEEPSENEEIEAMRREAEALWDETFEENIPQEELAEESSIEDHEAEDVQETMEIENEKEDEIDTIEAMRREAEELWEESFSHDTCSNHEPFSEEEMKMVGELINEIPEEESEAVESLINEIAEIRGEDMEDIAKEEVLKEENLQEGGNEEEFIEAETMEVEEEMGEETISDNKILRLELADEGKTEERNEAAEIAASMEKEGPLRISEETTLPYGMPLALEGRKFAEERFGGLSNTPIQEAMKNFGIEVGTDFKLKTPEQKKAESEEIAVVPIETPLIENKGSQEEESSILPALSKFLKETDHFNALSRTIDRNEDEWEYPSMVALGEEILTESEYDTLNEFMRVSGQYPPRILSFEIQESITSKNARECFFRAVSNSSWAHEGYLVSAAIENDPEGSVRRELKNLSSAFGIGVILLDIETPENSEILFPAKKTDEVDMDSVSRLLTASKNKDFIDFIETINEISRTQELDEGRFDRVVSYSEIQEIAKRRLG